MLYPAKPRPDGTASKRQLIPIRFIRQSLLNMSHGPEARSTGHIKRTHRSHPQVSYIETGESR